MDPVGTSILRYLINPPDFAGKTNTIHIVEPSSSAATGHGKVQDSGSTYNMSHTGLWYRTAGSLNTK